MSIGGLQKRLERLERIANPQSILFLVGVPVKNQPEPTHEELRAQMAEADEAAEAFRATGGTPLRINILPPGWRP